MATQKLQKDVFSKAAFTVQLTSTKKKDEGAGLATNILSYIYMI